MGIHTVQDAINAINAINAIHAIDSAIDDIVDIHWDVFTINSDIIAINNDIIAINIINNGIDAMSIDNGYSDINSVNISIENAIAMNNKRAGTATQIPAPCSRKKMIEHMENTVSEIKKNLRENIRENIRENLREDLRGFIEQIRNTINTHNSKSKEFKEMKGVVTSIQNNMYIKNLFPGLNKLITSVLKEINEHENGGMQ